MANLKFNRVYILCCIPGQWDPNEFSIEELVRAGMAITEIGMRQPKLQVLGGTVIVDLEGLSLKHVAALTPTVAYQMVSLMGVSSIKCYLYLLWDDIIFVKPSCPKR